MRRLYTATKKGDLIMQNHPGWYYGEEFGGIRRKKPGNPKLFTLDDFYGALRIAWSRDTAYPGCQVDWEPSDPSYGQCAVTAMLAYDLFAAISAGSAMQTAARTTSTASTVTSST